MYSLPPSGRSFAIVPRDIAPKGYYDIGKDDYKDGEILDEQQNIILNTSYRVKAQYQ